MKQHTISLLTFLAFFLCTPKTEASKQETNAALSQMVKSYYQDGWKLFPVNATMQGDHRYNDRMQNDLTWASKEKLIACYDSYLNQLEDYE